MRQKRMPRPQSRSAPGAKITISLRDMSAFTSANSIGLAPAMLGVKPLGYGFGQAKSSARPGFGVPDSAEAGVPTGSTRLAN